MEAECKQSLAAAAPVKVNKPSAPVPFVRTNHVTSVMLYDVPIVCLFIDGGERLCLAQISNTLLKDFSYNEIHNRRVALGITCVQCTPVQLEILRRAGAMPVSSRRCGMITKREAERLVKSFLEDIHPPKLPDDFTFDVRHECGWGCKGNFYPSRYNSSRAKCVKCKYCNMFFSANKFIFHFHRLPSSKYSHPDAANFNSWRRHLLLDDPDHNEDLLYAWEDVKAMFNGGSRKRMMPTSFKSIEPSHSFTKFQRQSNTESNKPVAYTRRSPMVAEPTSSSLYKPQSVLHPSLYPRYQQHSNLMPFPPANNQLYGMSNYINKSPTTSCTGIPRNSIFPTSYDLLWTKHLNSSMPNVQQSLFNFHSVLKNSMLRAPAVAAPGRELEHCIAKSGNRSRSISPVSRVSSATEHAHTARNLFRPYALGSDTDTDVESIDFQSPCETKSTSKQIRQQIEELDHEDTGAIFFDKEECEEGRLQHEGCQDDGSVNKDEIGIFQHDHARNVSPCGNPTVDDQEVLV